MTKRFTKRDVIFLSVLAAALAAFAIFYLMRGSVQGDRVEILIDGDVYGSYSLGEDREIPIEIDGEVCNVLKIEGGSADMVEANCPDKLCVHQRAISKDKETIVCLPHKIVVEVISDTESGFDSIAK